MQKKLIIEPVGDAGESFRLTPNVRHDIETIFQADQMELDLFQG
jgi:hypothetical protein